MSTFIIAFNKIDFFVNIKYNNDRMYSKSALIAKEVFLMEKTKHQPLLSAIIAVVLSNISIIVAIIIGIFGSWLLDEGVTFIGIPSTIILLIAVVFVFALVDYIVRRSKASAVIITFTLLLVVAYIAFYIVIEVAVYSIFKLFEAVLW